MRGWGSAAETQKEAVRCTKRVSTNKKQEKGEKYMDARANTLTVCTDRSTDLIFSLVKFLKKKSEVVMV